MLDKKSFVQSYEQLIRDKAAGEEELCLIQDKIVKATAELAALNEAKKEYAQLQVEYEKKLAEIEQKKQASLAEIDRHKENTGRIVDQQLARAEAKDQESSQREKNIAATEKRQHQKGIQQAANDDDLKKRYESLFHREMKAEKQEEQNKQDAEKNALDISHVKQRQKEVDVQQIQAAAVTQENTEASKGIQEEYVKQRQERQKIKEREQKCTEREEAADKKEADLDAREAELNSRAIKADTCTQELNKRTKDLDDKEKNLTAEKDDLAFKQAQSDSDIEKAKRKNIIKEINLDTREANIDARAKELDKRAKK